MSVRTRGLLMGGVSIVALTVCGAAALAADMPTKAPMVTKAPVLAPAVWNWWVEGGASNLSGGDAYVAGFDSPGFAPTAKKWGLEGAVGFDYRFDSAWHVSGQFRYGRNKAASKTHSPTGTFNLPGFTTTTTGEGGTGTVPITVAGKVVGSGSAERKESHWLVDFMVGRDMNIGLGSTQAKLGVRVASITGKTTGSATWNVPVATTTTAVAAQNLSYVQESKFLGVGPRAALDGSVPLGGAWSFDYNVGVAALFGDRQLSQTATYSGANVNPCIAGCPGTFTNNSSGTVFNFDAQPGISYAISRNAKLTASYRFDGYWNAMRVADSAGNITNVDRIYQGGFLRLGFNY
jgi:hypothetical protein